MAAIAQVVAYDGAATTVAHIFVPVSVSRDKPNRVKAEYRETGLAVPTVAQPRLTLTLERLSSGIYRLERRLVVPVMEAVSGQNAAGYTAAPKVAHEMTDVRIGFFHERSDVAGRRLVRHLGANIDNANVNSTPAVATSGAVPDLFDQLVSPT